MTAKDYIKAYEIGMADGQRKAMIELHKQIINSDLPSRDALEKILILISDWEKANRSSAFMNEWECKINHIITHWFDK